MKRFDFKSLSVGILLGASVVLGVAAINDTPVAQTEYRVVHGSVHDGELQRNLSNAATEGWKLEESDSITARSAYAV